VRRSVLAAGAVLAVLGAGCMPSQRLAEGELQRLVVLSAPAGGEAPLHTPVVGERTLPGRWVIRQRPSVIWSAISLVRAADRLEEGAAEIEIAVSPAHAQALGGVLAEARAALTDLADVAEAESGTDRRRWAAAVASALGRLEGVARLASVEDLAGDGEPEEEPTGLAAGPLLELVAAYLNERSGGGLLGDLAPAETDRLRAILVQTVLQVGFAAAGRNLPADVRDAAARAMRDAPRPDAVAAALAPLLEEALERASPGSGGGSLGRTVRTVLTWAPKALRGLEAFVNQWDAVRSLDVAFHQAGGKVRVAVTLHVLPGREVVLKDMMWFQPVIAFRGSTRIVVEAEDPATGEAVVAFEPVEGGGGVEMRFEGLLYGLARLLAMPLADARLRELRVQAEGGEAGARVLNVALVMEALGARGDPRRMLVFQDVRRRALRREALDVTSTVTRKDLVFNYLTPEKRYTYRRSR